MKLKHTPGPWKSGFAGSDRGDELVVVNGDPKAGETIQFICIVTPMDKFVKSDEANARLIAAAPEMLEALIEEYIIAKSVPCDKSLMQRLQPIIEKATGFKNEEVLE